MKKYWKSICISLLVLILAGVLWGGYIYKVSQDNIEKKNICQDDELIAQLIEQNINPFII